MDITKTAKKAARLIVVKYYAKFLIPSDPLVWAHSPAHYPHHPRQAPMGRARTKTVKKAARFNVVQYYAELTLDLQMNKRRWA